MLMLSSLLLSLVLASLSSQSSSPSSSSSPAFHLDGTIRSYVQYPAWQHFFSPIKASELAVESSSLERSITDVSLSFEFRAHPARGSRPAGGLLLYADDGTSLGGVFIELKLIGETNLRLRIDDRSGLRTKNIIELRQDINFTDGLWHRVELTRHSRLDETDDTIEAASDHRYEAITLKVDSETIHKRIELSAQQQSSQNGSMFMGGIPHSYRHNHHHHPLAVATVAYELHFRGSIRSLHYASYVDGKQVVLHNQAPVAQDGILEKESLNQTVECSENVCQHHGFCYETNNGTECDCSLTSYEGPYCQKERFLSEATFRGTLGEYLGFNSIDLLPTGWAVISTSEEFQLSFRTKVPNGLLLFTSDENEDYLAITMRDAALSLTLKLGATLQEKLIKPSKIRFDDNQWHSVTITRKIREISPLTYFCQYSITVDGLYSQVGSGAGTIPYFVFKSLFLGGLASAKDQSFVSTDASQLATGSNFVGCLRKVIYKADNIVMDLLDMVERQQHHPNSHSAVALFRFYGQHHKDHRDHHHHHNKHHQAQSMVCEMTDVSDPITFVTEDSYLKLGGWNSSRNGSISLKIRTNEANGVLLYTMGGPKEANSSQRDYFALELLHGQLFMLLNLGSSPVKVKASAHRLDDSQWHTISVTRFEKTGQVVVDDTASDFIAIGTATHLDLDNALFLGGVPRFIGHRRTFTPPELWSASLGFGFIGCMKQLTINTKTIDIAAYAKRQDSGGVKPSCHASASQCSSVSPCQNGGTCHEGWNRYTCDCSHTLFTGSVCAKNAASLGFNGEQYLTIVESEDVRSQAESMSIRFRSTRPTGLLMASSHADYPNNYFVVSLESGVIKVDVNFGESHQERVASIGVALNDDKWHTVRIDRKGPSLKIELDTSKRHIVELVAPSHVLHIGYIHIGAWFNPPKAQGARHYKGFVGYMQNFIFNGQSYFEKVRDGQLNSGSIRMTAKFGKKERILHNQVTFKSKNTFVGLPQLKAYTRLDVYFQFKTREPDGLIFFNGGGPKHDFVAIELVDGQLHYVFDQGDGVRRLQSKSRNSLNDNRWHTVTLGRPSLHQHTMLIDETLITASTTSGNEKNLHLDLDGLLYFGGVRDSMWDTLPKTIRSRSGFEGCIASLDLNGETFNLAGSEVLIPSTLVEPGCSAPIARCSSTACANRGICVQLWNSYTCDCDLTTFSGPTCAEGNESTAYQFGPSPGLMTFTFDENNRPDTRNDLLALGFLTSQSNGALVRVDSGTSADYLQVELLDGNILIIYNLGTEDIDIGEFNLKLNDAKYHIVRFTRSGQNSTLQIDNHNVITKSPEGKQLNIFNSHAKIQIGGHKNVLKGVVEKPFDGILAGLVFNGHRLFDMAAEDDARIAIQGDVELMISIGNQQSGQTTPTTNDKANNQMLSEDKKSSSGNANNDDLIYSGAGSGCYDVADDEECTHAAHEGSGGDELITPVYKVVSRLRPTTSPPRRPDNSNNVYRKNCDNEDDDDCVEGSGGDRRGDARHRGSYNQSYSYNQYGRYSTTHRPRTTWTPPTVSPLNRPPGAIPPFSPPTYHGGIYSGSYPGSEIYQRPKTTAPAWTKPVYSVSGPSRPINTPPLIIPQGPPEILDVPLNIPTVSNDTPPTEYSPPNQIVTRASSNDRTVMIIGIIAIILIVVVIIAPIVLFYKVRLQTSNPAYKVEGMTGSKLSTMPMLPGGGYPGYQGFPPVVRATSISGIPGHPGMMAPHPGAMGLTRSVSRPGTRPVTPIDGLAMGGGGGKKKQLHEWYV